jgi:hypothetical protein
MVKKSKEVNPTEVAITVGKNSNNENIIVIVNGKKVDLKKVKSLTVQYVEGALVLDLNYDVENEFDSSVKRPVAIEKQKPSLKGIETQKTKGPEVYPLEEANLLKLEAMSFLRTNKTENDKPVSKLKVTLNNAKEFEIIEKEITTEDFNITEITSISSALNDMAVQEQKIQKDSKVVKVEEVLKPQIIITGNIFHLVEKFKLYQVKE